LLKFLEETFLKFLLVLVTSRECHFGKDDLCFITVRPGTPWSSPLSQIPVCKTLRKLSVKRIQFGACLSDSRLIFKDSRVQLEQLTSPKQHPGSKMTHLLCLGNVSETAFSTATFSHQCH